MSGVSASPALIGGNDTTVIDILRTALPYLSKRFADTLRDTDSPFTRLLIEPMRQSGSGTGYQKTSRARTRGTAKFVNLYEPNTEAQADIMVSHNSPFVHSEKFALVDQKEIDMATGAEQVVDIAEGRISEQAEDMINLWEDSAAGVPNSNDDTKSIRGVLYFLPTIAPSGTVDYVGGFNGSTVTFRDGTTTSTTIAGVDRSAARNNRFLSWNANYSGDIDDVFLDTLRRARTRTKFHSIGYLRGEKPDESKPNYLFMPHTQADLCEKRANKGPDDWQNDLNRYVDPTIAGMQPIRVPTWESLAYAPIVGVRTSKWTIRVLKDRWMKLLPPRMSATQTEVAVTPMVSSLLMHCDDPRSGGFTIAKAR